MTQFATSCTLQVQRRHTATVGVATCGEVALKELPNGAAIKAASGISRVESPTRTINQQRRQQGAGQRVWLKMEMLCVCVFASTGHARNLEGAQHRQHIFYCSLHIAPLTVAYCSFYDAIAAWIMQCAWLRKN